MFEQLSVWASQSDESEEGSPSAQDSRNCRETLPPSLAPSLRKPFHFLPFHFYCRQE